MATSPSKRPKQIIRAIGFLSGALVIGFFILKPNFFDFSILFFLTGIFAIPAFLIIQISRRSNWARIVYLIVIVGMTLPFYIPFVFLGFGDNILVGLAILVAITLQLIGTIFLFQTPSNIWFTYGETDNLCSTNTAKQIVLKTFHKMLPDSFWRDKLITNLLLILMFVLVQMIVSVGMMFFHFFLIAHAHINFAITAFIRFFTQIEIDSLTIVWYFIAALFVGLGWVITKKIESNWYRITLRVGLIGLLLAPGFFVDSHTSNSLLLPAVVSIGKHAVQSYVGYFAATAFWLSFWTIPSTWVILIFIIIIRMVAKKP